MDMKRFFLYLSMMTALALAGCGSDGKQMVTTDPGTMTPTPVAVDLGMLLTGYTTVPAGTYDIAGDASMNVGHATFSCPAGDGCVVTVAADGSVMATGGATAMASQTARDAKAAADKTARVAETKKAVAISTAIEAKAPKAGASGLPAVVTVKRDPAGDPMITLSPDASIKDNMPTEYDPKYAKATDVTTPAIAGWSGETQTRSDATTGADSVTVYTDIKNATPMKLKAKSTDKVDDKPLDLKLADAILLTDGEKKEYKEDDTFAGTFRGAPGTFTCTASAGCTVTFVDGKTAGQDPKTVARISATWSFESTDYVKSLAEQDGDYLYFGYWLNEKDAKYKFGTFYGGADSFAISTDLTGNKDTAFKAVDSKATYTGRAGGRYVEKTLGVVDGSLKSTSATEGQFTANASLTAYFGQSTGVASDLHNTISGAITDFKDGDKDLGFNVKLESVDIKVGSSGLIGGTVDAIHGTTQDNDTGSWAGQFFGPAGDADKKVTTFPTGVAGEFEANFSDGNVAGAFGATKD